jgi:hypothetical protein
VLRGKREGYDRKGTSVSLERTITPDGDDATAPGAAPGRGAGQRGERRVKFFCWTTPRVSVGGGGVRARESR